MVGKIWWCLILVMMRSCRASSINAEHALVTVRTVHYPGVHGPLHRLGVNGIGQKGHRNPALCPAARRLAATQI